MSVRYFLHLNTSNYLQNCRQYIYRLWYQWSSTIWGWGSGPWESDHWHGCTRGVTADVPFMPSITMIQYLNLWAQSIEGRRRSWGNGLLKAERGMDRQRRKTQRQNTMSCFKKKSELVYTQRTQSKGKPWRNEQKVGVTRI